MLPLAQESPSGSEDIKGPAQLLSHTWGYVMLQIRIPSSFIQGGPPNEEGAALLVLLL